MRLSDELQGEHDCGDFGDGLCGYPEKARNLESAFQKLIDLAQECDSWESFPSSALDEAQAVIENNES